MAGCIAHARNGHISTSALKSDVTVMFVDPNLLRCENFSNSAVNKGYLYIFYCACAIRPYFRSKIWRHNRVPRSRYPKWREIFGDSCTFKAAIVVVNICMNFQDHLA